MTRDIVTIQISGNGENVRIKTKLVSSFSLIIVLLVVVSFVGSWGISRMNELLNEYALTEGKLVESAQRSRANINQLRRFEKDAFINIESSEKVTEYSKKWQESYDHCVKRFEVIEDLLKKLENGHDAELSKGFKTTVATLRTGLNSYASGFNTVLGKIKSGEIKTTQEANNAIGAYKESIHKLEKDTVQLADDMDKMMASGIAEADGIQKKLHITISAVSIIAVLLAIFLTIIILRAILKPLGHMLEMITDIAQGEGDLTRRLDDSTGDELAEISRMFNRFIEKLHGIISHVAQTTTQVATAASQVHSTAEQMATSSEEVTAQASSIATAGEEMAATSGDIAQNCQYAAEGSKQANEGAMTGAKVVEETISVMNSIAERVKKSAKTVESLGSRSDQIGEIVGTIEDIADQTNLLALNAAIEAARAGEQGRGFAVVADEVRALAERTTRATREIGEMIKAIQSETRSAVVAMEEGVNEVAKGTEKAAKSGEALEQILEQINSVTSQIHQVATAAEEQTATTSEISNNMHQITEVVHQTSIGAQQSAAAADNLSRLSGELQQLVQQFKLN
jgi:methyl-accepting chemotaxis protein